MAEKHFDASGVVVRPALRVDMADVADMIRELADFEKMPDGPKLTKEDLERDGFDISPPKFRCLVAVADGEVTLGYAIFFPSYSTWGGAAMALEDLYVRPEARRQGVGGKLFDSVAKEAHAAGCCRLDFHVLEWNPARAFYESRGARDLTRAEAWACFRLEGPALAVTAAAASH